MHQQKTLLISWLGRQCYQSTWQAMKKYTDLRQNDWPDQLWLLEHDPVFTQGQAGKAEHLLNPGDIPIVCSDRGGQVTYHGPGQLVGYYLMGLRQSKLTARGLVTAVESAIVNTLATYKIQSEPRPDAPGVYIPRVCQDNQTSTWQSQFEKIASLGFRVRRGYAYHGFALNIQMDLTPFQLINPCGYSGLGMAQMADFLKPVPSLQQVAMQLSQQLILLNPYDRVLTLSSHLENLLMLADQASHASLAWQE